MSKRKENRSKDVDVDKCVNKHEEIDGDDSEYTDDEQYSICEVVIKLKDKNSIAMTCIGLAQLRLTIQDSVDMGSIIRETIDNLIEVTSSDLTELYNTLIYPKLGPIRTIESIGTFFDAWYDGYIDSIHAVIKTIVKDECYKLVCNKPGTMQIRGVIR